MDLAHLPYAIGRGLRLYTDVYLRRRTLTLIYTPGRVGSIAMYSALAARGVTAVHLHTLLPARISTQPGSTRLAYRVIVQGGRPANVITIARDPLALMMSDFFSKVRWITGQEDAAVRLPPDALCTLFNTAYFEQQRHRFILDWYEREFKTSLGVDVYTHESPRAEGYARFQDRRFRVLALRSRLDDTIKSRAVADFLNLPDLTIERRNIREESIQGDNYRLFKDQIVVPPQHLDTVYNSTYARHFFTAGELADFRQRWGGR